MTQDGKCKRTTTPIQGVVKVKLDEPYPDAMPKDLARKFRQR